jgi:tetratricopeptide (TPR) repeat protein
MSTILLGIMTGGIILVGAFLIFSKAAKGDLTSYIGGKLFAPLLLVAFAFGVYKVTVLNPVLGLFFVLAFAVPVAFIATPMIGRMIAAPITGSIDGAGEAETPKPFYSVAIGRRKGGDIGGALEAVAEQRAKFPEDVDGVLLEADIQRRDRKDSGSALACILEWLALQQRPQSDVMRALRDASEIQFDSGDTEGAVRSLEKIVAMNPESSAGQAAAQRLAHLDDPEERAKVRDSLRLDGRTFARDIGLRADHGASLVSEKEDPAVTRERLMEHVGDHPEDWEGRETLARLEEEAGNIGRAVTLLEELAASASAPPKIVSRWLNHIAEIHIRVGAMPSARGALQRIVERFPETSYANLAESRIRLLPLEAKARRQTATVPMRRGDPEESPV